jgi:hypothetical protein
LENKVGLKENFGLEIDSGAFKTGTRDEKRARK